MISVQDGALIDKMLAAWFSPETQAATQALVARLARERRGEATAP